MNKGSIQAAQALAYAGVMPFLLLSLAVAGKITGYDFDLALRSYGAGIISFLCGIHWAVALLLPEKCPRNLLISSNAVTLVAWASVLLGLHGLDCVIQSLCFVYLLKLDLELLNLHIIPIWYFQLRRNVTCIVSLLLLGTACLS